LAEWKTFLMGTPTTLSRGSVKDACSMRYASGEKARRILGYEARVGIEEGLRVSCQVSHFQDLWRLQHMLMHITGLRTPITATREVPARRSTQRTHESPSIGVMGGWARSIPVL
jgi:hypothetical protein